MYIPKYYKLEDQDEIQRFLKANSFAILISNHEGVPVGTHIPLEIEKTDEGQLILQGHIARGNPQWRTFAENKQVLAIFSGPHTYVSSSWYSQVNVPTWNYQAVHVYGSVRIIDGEELKTTLSRLVKKYENIAKNPVSVETMPHDMIEKQMRAIVGFEISIEKIEAKYKLSQNRTEDDYKNIIKELKELDNPDSDKIANEMERLKGAMKNEE